MPSRDQAMQVARDLAASIRARKITSDNTDYRGIWLPNSRVDGTLGPQGAAVASSAFEIFFGGSAGGGKSWTGLGLAITQHQRSIFFRRTYPQLKDIIEDSKRLLEGTGAIYNAGSHTWSGIPGGRSLEFGHVVNDHALNAYKGRPHDLKIFDEVSDFPERYYIFLSGWTRSTDPAQKLQVFAAGNPPTSAEGEWVILRWQAWLDPQFPYPALPGELRWYARLDDQEVERENGEPFTFKGETIKPKSRTFIPARLEDNPTYANSDYGSVLQSLPEPLRSQLLYGDFTIKAASDRWQVIPTNYVQTANALWEHTEKPQAAQRSLGVDVAHGGGDKSVIAPLYQTWFDKLVKMAGSQTPDGQSMVEEIRRVWNGHAKIAIDSIGYGASAYDVARENNMKPLGVNFGVKSFRRDKSGLFEFANLRAEAYWKFREALDPESGEHICLPPDRELLADLCAPRYSTVGGKILVEKKEDVAKRIGRSPDCGDAVVLAWYGAYSGWSDDDLNVFLTNKIDESQIDSRLTEAARMSGLKPKAKEEA